MRRRVWWAWDAVTERETEMHARTCITSLLNRLAAQTRISQSDSQFLAAASSAQAWPSNRSSSSGGGGDGVATEENSGIATTAAANTTGAIRQRPLARRGQINDVVGRRNCDGQQTTGAAIVGCAVWSAGRQGRQGRGVCWHCLLRVLYSCRLVWHIAVCVCVCVWRLHWVVGRAFRLACTLFPGVLARKQLLY